MPLTIPAGVERVVLAIRHSLAPKSGADSNKTLTLDGVNLCHAVAVFYTRLISEITMAMPAAPTFHCSSFPRSMMTAWEIFRAANIQPEEALKVWASLMSINQGEWAKALMAAGKGEPAMIREFLGDRSLMTQAFAEYHGNYCNFISGATGSEEARKAKFVVATCHEAGISLAAKDFLPADQLGLANCEAVLFYVAGGVIVGAEKIVPEKEALES